MVASFSPENTFSAMILVQASIIWSAGVVSVVQSGPSWPRDWAWPGADHSRAANRTGIRSRRRKDTSGGWRVLTGVRRLVAKAGFRVQVAGCLLPGYFL